MVSVLGKQPCQVAYRVERLGRKRSIHSISQGKREWTITPEPDREHLRPDRLFCAACSCGLLL